MSGQRMNVGTLFVELLLDDSELGTGTARATKRLSSFADGLRSVAQKIDATLTAALERAALAAAGVATAAVVVGASFEKQMSKVASVAGSTTEELAALTEEARRIGATTQFSATDAAEGMEALASAGFSTKEIITATADAMALAGANAVDLDTATSLVAATLTQFNLSASDAGRVSDVFTAAAQASLLTVGDLAVAMRYAGTAGAVLGYSLEETTAAVAMFRDIGLTGEQAGTNFRAMMESLANPTQKATDVLGDLGIEFEEINPAMHSFDEIVQTLAASGIDLGQSYAIFGSIAGGNVMSLVEDWREAGGEANKYQQILDELVTSHGTAQRSFDAMADNVAGGWDRLKSSAEEFLLVLFDMGKGPLKRLMEGLTERLDLLARTFAKGAEDGSNKLDRLVDGALALADAAILLLPRLEEIGVAMIAALVTSKGVTYAIALVELGAMFGVNLPAAIGKAVTALRAMTVAQAAFTVTGLGLVLAGLAAFAVAIVKIADSFTGAARAARELAGAQQGARQFSEANEAEQRQTEAALEATKQEISARAKAGEAISNNERALLEYTAAQAYAEIQAGKMVAWTDRVAFTSEVATDTVREFQEALVGQAEDAKATAETLKYLAEQYKTTPELIPFVGVADLMQGGNQTLADMAQSAIGKQLNPGLFLGPLSKARELTGLQINSFEDLNAAIAELDATSEQASKRASNLDTQLAQQAAAATEAKRAADALAASTAGVATETTHLTTEQKEAAKAAEKTAEARTASGDGFRNWLESWANDASVGEELLDDLNQQVRDLPDHLAEIGAAQSQTLPMVVESFGTLNDRAKSVADELLAIEESAKRGPFQKLADGALAFGQRVEDGVLNVLRRGFESLWSGMKSGASTAASAVTGLFRPLLDMISPAAILAPLAPLFDLKGIFSSSRGENLTNKPDEQVEKMRARQAVTAAAESAASFVTGFVAALPAMLEALVEQLPVVLDALIEGIPDLIEALAEAIPDLIGVLVEKLPILVDAVLSALPGLIRALGDGVVQIVGMLPELITAILSNLPSIITALANQVPKIITAIVDAVPEIIIAIVTQLPAIAFALIKAAPKIVMAFVTLVPRVIWGVIKALPEIVTAFWESFKDIWPKFVEWAGKIAKMIGNAFMEVITLGLFKSDKEKEKGNGKGGGFLGLGNLFDKKTERAASGIDYVPRTMATVLEPGEAVLDALANQARLRRELNEPGPIPTGGAGGGSFAFGIHFDGRLMDEVLVSGLSSGRAPGLKRTLRTTSGRRPGFSRGRFQPFAG